MANLARAFLAFWLMVGSAIADGHDGLEELVSNTFAAFNANDLAQATALAEQAEAIARTAPEADPDLAAIALTNLAWARRQSGGDRAEIEQLYRDAVAHLETHGVVPSQTWLNAIGLLGGYLATEGEIDDPRLLAQRAIDQTARTEFEGPGTGTASSIYFDLGDYETAAATMIRVLEIAPDILAPFSGQIFANYRNARDVAEADGRIGAVEALLDGQIALATQFMDPGEDQDLMISELMLNKFFPNQSAGNYLQAAAALDAWGDFGVFSPENRAFVEDNAQSFVTLADASQAKEPLPDQYGYARVAVAFTGLLADPDNPLRGAALRALGNVQSKLGRQSDALDSFQRAVAVLSRTEDGRNSLHLLFADMAASAWLQGDYALSRDLYARADAAYATALSNGAEPLTPMDHVITSINRANMLVDAGAYDEARDWVASSRALFAEARSTQDLKWNGLYQGSRIEATEARILDAQGDGPAAIAASRLALSMARDTLPANHPELALNLANTADILAVRDEREGAIELLEEAAALFQTILDKDAPNAIDASMKLAQVRLSMGDRTGATEVVRDLTEERKSPTYRDLLPDASFEFEILAWLLLDRDNSSPEDLDEAFRALQWTQITRSAEALAMMEARLAASDPGLGDLLRRRQDMIENRRRTAETLLAAYASDEADEEQRRILSDVYAGTGEDLAALEQALSRAGLGETSLASVDPMTVVEVQDRLDPGEVLVTFLLPSLNLETVEGLSGSTNRVIAITADETRVAVVPEHSRRSLNRRIQAFRCDVAVSDPGCEGGGAEGLRGAANASEPIDEGALFNADAAFALYDDLFGGIDDLLQTHESVIIVPPSDLLRLPFPALVTDVAFSDALADQAWFARRNAISVLPSVASLRTLRRGAAPRAALGRYLGVGDPVIGRASAIDCDAFQVAALRSAPAGLQPMSDRTSDTGLRLADPSILRDMPRLPDAACELAAIGDAFAPENRDILTGTAATEAAVKALNGSGALAETDILVFATHGLTAGEAGAAAPGLVLTPPEMATPEDDGLLTAAEIATLRLNASLVVLSACNTAAGEEGNTDGMSGLARAFFHAGAKSLLVTHWSVYSEAAVDVSTGLFSELRKDPGLSNAQALRRSVLAILDDPASGTFRQHPSYWAAFAVVGAT